ncbi:MAG: hypothetical protein OEX08_01330 [Candidatus Nomurabacteria bacterium]|nr:hypothetical protein [Candidatus Nomurabacteria bacterium]
MEKIGKIIAWGLLGILILAGIASYFLRDKDIKEVNEKEDKDEHI